MIRFKVLMKLNRTLSFLYSNAWTGETRLSPKTIKVYLRHEADEKYNLNFEFSFNFVNKNSLHPAIDDKK